MTGKKEITGYYTDDGNIHCVDCTLKTQEQIREEIESHYRRNLGTPQLKQPKVFTLVQMSNINGSKLRG